MVKRYDDTPIEELESPTGGFVLYSDYEKLEEENEELRKQVEQMKSAWKSWLNMENEKPDQTAGPSQNGHIPDAGKKIEVGQVWETLDEEGERIEAGIITEEDPDGMLKLNGVWYESGALLKSEWKLYRHADGRLVEVEE